MRLRLILLGLFLLLLTGNPVAHAQSGAGGYQLYEKMRTITNQEVELEGVSSKVITYLTRLLAQEKMIPEGKAAADMEEVVKAALEQRLDDFCEQYEAVLDGCPQAYQMIRDWASDILDVQSLTYDLLHIATGYETGVSGNLGEVFTVSERLLDIRHLWEGRDDLLLTSEAFPPVRAVPRPDGLSDGMFSELGQALSDAGSDAVWRYRYGTASFLNSGEPCRDGGGDPELYNVTTRRWCQVEEKLKSIREALPSSSLSYTPPLQRGEIVIFPLRKLETPPHVVVWMMAEKVGEAVERDVGVGWDLALDPVFPGIIREDSGEPCDRGELSDSFCIVAESFSIRPGGLYADPPEEPEKDEGVCHLAFGRDGYLCRPLRHDRCNAELRDKTPMSIVLTECKPTKARQPAGLTQSGPDTCRTGWWRIPTDETMNTKAPPFDQIDTDRPGRCSLCKVDMYCEDSCINGDIAHTYPKKDNGIIRICLSNSVSPAFLRTAILHELVHAQQECGLEANTNVFDSAEKCCALESEAYTVGCRVLAEDGILDRAGISLEECVGGRANVSCNGYGERVCSRLGSADIDHKLSRAILEWAKTPGLNLPTCTDLSNAFNGQGTAAIMNYDSRILSMIEGMNGVCTPGCQTKYENTIGANLCYTGRCIEQSVEESRLIPGRMALSVQDESFPWDACANEDPRNGALIALPAISPPLAPPYNPRLLVESLDRALCQINGLPAFTPPIICLFDYQRRLMTPTESYATTTVSSGEQVQENVEPTAALQRITQGIATRIGTNLLTQYLAWAGRTLSETVRASNQLIRQMEQTKFPNVTCPRNAAEKPSFCSASSPP